MSPLMEELVAIYQRYIPYEYPGDMSLYELADLIVRLAAPNDVGDVMMLPEEFRIQGLIYLIEKDASDEYDQITGFVDTVICEHGLEAFITPAEHGFDGLKLCEWIDQILPREVEACP